MGKGKDEDDEILPTPEQAQAYAERARAAIALARLDKYCAGLPKTGYYSHTSEHGCFVLPSLGLSLVAVEHRGAVGLGMPTTHANWIEDFPLDFIAATKEELFFVSKGFSWLGSEVPALGISLGPILSSTLLSRLCNQNTVEFFCIKGDLGSATQGDAMRIERPALVYLVPDNMEVMKTRQHYEKMANSNRSDTHSVITDHFLG